MVMDSAMTICREFSQGLLWKLGAEGLLLGELYARVR
jgi:hypothetical protein